MLIRKLFKFEGSHIVRNCSSERCKYSIHGHSFKLELILEASRLDQGQMVYDFGLLKGPIKDLIDGFDHACLFWNKDTKEFTEAIHQHSKRWISLPVSPTAEQLSRVFFVLMDGFLTNTTKVNDDEAVQVHSTILHETETGCAQCFREDAFNPSMGEIKLQEIVFSEAIQLDWRDPHMWNDFLKKQKFINKAPEIQIARG